MELQIKSRKSGKTSTISELYLDGKYFCLTLEDVVREVPGQPVETWKVPKATAIPSGRYRVQYTWSNRFGKKMLQLMNVPGYTGIRIHPGNFHTDTEGCVMPGTAVAPGGEAITGSVKAYDRLLPVVLAALERGEEVWCEVVRAGLG